MKCRMCNQVVRWQVPLVKLLSFEPISAPTICDSCRNNFQEYQPPFCRGCGRTCASGLCDECQYWQAKYGWLVHNHCMFHYDEAMKEFMHRYKFVGDYRLRYVFHADMRRWINQQTFDYLIPIPVTPETMSIRGFNQTIGLIGNCDQGLLVTKHSQKSVPQSKKGRIERLKTPQPFTLTPQVNLHQKRILVVDDVYTTGRTMYHAVALLKAAGAKAVHTLTLSG